MLPTPKPAWDISDMAEADELRGARLYQALMAIKPAGLAETDWAVQAGVNRGFFTNLKSSNIAPRSDTLRKLLRTIGKAEADLYPTTIHDVASFKAPSAPGDPPLSLDVLAAEYGFAMVEQVDLALGMGATYLDGNKPEVLGIVPFRADWLRGLHEGPIERLKVVSGRGDSMEPTIRDGDLVLVDTAQRLVKDQDMIWAVAYGELGMIRRVRVTPRGTWMLMPDNAVVRPDEVGDGEASIIGRVIWIGRRV